MSFDKFLNTHRDRVVGLDVLRSFAILIVVYEHGINMFSKPYHQFYKSINPFRMDGVSIFFVLSGFLIGGILLRTIEKGDFTSKDLLNFWIRRWFRTIPNYLFVLLAILGYQLLFFKNIGEFNLRYLLFSQNLTSPHPDFFPEAWSLTIEEWFYFLFPVSCFIFHKVLKSKSTSIFISALIFLIVPFVLRMLKYHAGIGVNEFDAEFRKVVILRLDSLMYGVIAAYIAFKQPGFWSNSKKMFLMLGIILLILLRLDPGNWTKFYLPFYFNIESITSFCFLPFLSSVKTTGRRNWDAIFIFISIISYSMYLLNQTPVKGHVIPLLTGVLRKTELNEFSISLINYVAFWFFTIAGSYLLYRFFENPVTKLRDKIKV
jgi:peptidoglycan/LPS O-acetylase OafA/YrhL